VSHDLVTLLLVLAIIVAFILLLGVAAYLLGKMPRHLVATALLGSVAVLVGPTFFRDMIHPGEALTASLTRILAYLVAGGLAFASASLGAPLIFALWRDRAVSWPQLGIAAVFVSVGVVSVWSTAQDHPSELLVEVCSVSIIVSVALFLLWSFDHGRTGLGAAPNKQGDHSLKDEAELESSPLPSQGKDDADEKVGTGAGSNEAALPPIRRKRNTKQRPGAGPTQKEDGENRERSREQ
jgi:hypothetical protein